MVDFFVSLDFRQQLAVSLAATMVMAAIGLILRPIWPPALHWLRKRLHRPTLVFVSTGGTCRDPMAKVITEQLVKGRTPRMRVYAAGLMKGHSERAAKAAQYVVRESLGKDLLKSHRTRQLDEKLVSTADLILAMDPKYVQSIVKAFPGARSKTHTLHGFLGLRGSIDNPYRAADEVDEKALSRYRACFQELRAVLTTHIDRIHAAVTLTPNIRVLP